MSGSLPGCGPGLNRSDLGQSRQVGFSLIEMMVALAIAAILLFVAVPAYEHAVVKSTRAAARMALLDVMSRQERYIVNNKRYGTVLGELGLPDPYYIDGKGDAVAPELSAYRVSLDLVGGTYQGVTAQPLNRQARDSACMSFSLSTVGMRTVSGSLSANPRHCW